MEVTIVHIDGHQTRVTVCAIIIFITKRISQI